MCLCGAWAECKVMTKTVISIRCANSEQFERITSLMKENFDMTERISSTVLGHKVAVHECDVVESALVLEKAQLLDTLAKVQERAG